MAAKNMYEDGYKFTWRTVNRSKQMQKKRGRKKHWFYYYNDPKALVNQ